MLLIFTFLLVLFINLRTLGYIIANNNAQYLCVTFPYVVVRTRYYHIFWLRLHRFYGVFYMSQRIAHGLTPAYLKFLSSDKRFHFSILSQKRIPSMFTMFATHRSSLMNFYMLPYSSDYILSLSDDPVSI